MVTINTHKGLYRFTRLPFGVASAPAIFQKLMESVLLGIPRVFCYIEDILITGASTTVNTTRIPQNKQLHSIDSSFLLIQ